MSISTIPTVTANTVGTPVLTTVQSKGLPDWYGKKDKTTTEQAYFTCNICECDLKSVITLRVLYLWYAGHLRENNCQSIRIKFQRVKCVTMKLTVLVRGMNTLDIGAG